MDIPLVGCLLKQEPSSHVHGICYVDWGGKGRGKCLLILLDYCLIIGECGTVFRRIHLLTWDLVAAAIRAWNNQTAVYVWVQKETTPYVTLDHTQPQPFPTHPTHLIPPPTSKPNPHPLTHTSPPPTPIPIPHHPRIPPSTYPTKMLGLTMLNNNSPYLTHTHTPPPPPPRPAPHLTPLTHSPQNTFKNTVHIQKSCKQCM